MDMLADLDHFNITNPIPLLKHLANTLYNTSHNHNCKPLYNATTEAISTLGVELKQHWANREALWN